MFNPSISRGMFCRFQQNVIGIKIAHTLASVCISFKNSVFFFINTNDLSLWSGENHLVAIEAYKLEVEAIFRTSDSDTLAVYKIDYHNYVVIFHILTTFRV